MYRLLFFLLQATEFRYLLARWIMSSRKEPVHSCLVFVQIIKDFIRSVFVKIHLENRQLSCKACKATTSLINTKYTRSLLLTTHFSTSLCPMNRKLACTTAMLMMTSQLQKYLWHVSSASVPVPCIFYLLLRSKPSTDDFKTIVVFSCI